MRGRRWAGFVLLAMAGGCQTAPSSRSVASAEPALSAPAGSGATVVGTKPERTVTWADHHPLFAKPRQYYEKSTSSNKVVKAAAATVIGIPAGIYGELRQIVVGSPQPGPY